MKSKTASMFLWICMVAMGMTAMMGMGCSKSKTDSAYSSEEYSSSSTSSSSRDSESGSVETYYTSEDSDDQTVYAEEVAVVSDGSSDDWDAMLKAYEEFADEYIAILKRAQKGEVSALSDYQKYMEKAQEYTTKMGAPSTSLTASQIAKFNRIQQKIAKAASSYAVDMSQMEAAQQAAMKASQEAVESLEALEKMLSSDDDDDDDDDEDD